jgi:DNA-binding NarL/FixJ family response regulator
MANHSVDPIALESLKPCITVLIADACESDRKTYAKHILSETNLNYLILEAETLEAGLDTWRFLAGCVPPQQPDLVLVGFNLPDGDGLAFLAELGRDSSARQLPAIVLMDRKDASTAVRVMKLGAIDCLFKADITAALLTESVRSAIAQISLSRKLLRAKQQESLIAEIALDVRRSLNLENVYAAIVQNVRAFLNADRAVVYKFNADMSGRVVAESVVPPWVPCLNAHVIDTCFQENMGGAYRDGRIFATTDIYASNLSECHVKLLERFQVRANLVVPILLSHPENNTKHLWGLSIVHQCSAPRNWEDSDLPLLQQLSIQLAIAIQQADELETSERKFREIFNNTFQFTGLLTLDGTV